MKFLFKTNLKCSGCVEKLSNILNREKDILQWDANLESEHKLVNIVSEKLSHDKLEKLIEEAGFKATLMG